MPINIFININYTVPTFSYALFFIIDANPKSIIFIGDPLDLFRKSTFSNFRSLWAIFFECKYTIPLNICFVTLAATSSEYLVRVNISLSSKWPPPQYLYIYIYILTNISYSKIR